MGFYGSNDPTNREDWRRITGLSGAHERREEV